MSPFDTKHPCSYPNCANLVAKGSRCPEHPYKKQFTPEHHGLYNSDKWKRMREYHLHKHSVCVICYKYNLDTGSKNLQVDHIVDHKGDDKLFYSWDNLQTLCIVHHSQKTGREQHERY